MLSFSKSALCLLLASPLIAAAIAAGCSSNPNTGGTAGTTNSGGGSNTGGSATGGSSVGGGGSAGTGGDMTDSGVPDTGFDGWVDPETGVPLPAACITKYYQCGDTLDNDGDGLIDYYDPDCLGPCDNSEDGLNLDIPGGDGPACTVDCYWDSNSGSGNDGCYWNHQCDPLSTQANGYNPEWWNGAACEYNANANTPGTELSCETLLNNQPASCLQICPSLTPNGCDCFGCCVLYKGGKEYGPVWLGTEDGNGNFTCDLNSLEDPKKCAPCTQVKGACFNGCGKCELCIGKTVDDLPPECFPPPPPPDGGVPDSGMDSGMDADPPPPDAEPPPPQCPTGVQPCGLPGQALCPGGYSCITGCCIQQPG